MEAEQFSRSEHCLCGSDSRTPYFIAAIPKRPATEDNPDYERWRTRGEKHSEPESRGVPRLNGSRVLLVDGDMRSSGLSGYIGFKRKEGVLTGHQKSGLSDALSGWGEPAVITPFSELPNLSVLPAGSDPKYPAELLGSELMQAFVRSSSGITTTC